jgi:uncharacterized delta-60 repeat protein
VIARPVGALAVLCVLAAATAAAAAVAPGLVTFPIAATARHDGVDVRGLSYGVGLPGKRALVGGVERSGAIALARLRADGSLDRAFGAGGIAHVDTARFHTQSLQLLRRPDGRLLVVAATGATTDRLVVVALSADGALERSFGDAGVAAPNLTWGCPTCSPAALAPDGSIVLTGGDPSAPADRRWVAVRLTPTGGLDVGFGQQGAAALPGVNATGFATALLPGGAVAVLGRDAGGAKLARLTAAGAPDAGFNGGVPVAPPGAAYSWFSLRGRPDGGVDTLGGARGFARLVRYTPGGRVDPAFGAGGVVTVKAWDGRVELLAAADGGDIVAAPPSNDPALGPPALRATRITAAGIVAGARDVPIPFGGGRASTFAAHRDPLVASLGQSGFVAGRPFARTDGSVVLPGAIGVVQYTGEGVGEEIDQAAVAAVTPSFLLDRSFGGPAWAATFSVRVARQRAASATRADVLGVAVSARASGPGLCLLRVRAGGRLIARSTAPVFSAGRQRLSALLTIAGRRYLRGHRHHVPVTVTAAFRDLVGASAQASAAGTLR